MAINFSQLKHQGRTKSLYLFIIFLKRIFDIKFFKYCTFWNIHFYFSSYFSNNLFIKKNKFSLIFLDNCCMITIHMLFYNCYTICGIICYESFSFFCISIKSMHKWLKQIKQTSHDLNFLKMNFSIIIYTIKSPTNCIPIMVFPYFSLSMQCFKIPFHFIIFIKICYFFCCILFFQATIQNFIFCIPFI